MIKKLLLLNFLTLSLISCTESKKSSEILIYENGDSNIKFKILNGKNYLVYDTPIKSNFEWNNIDQRNSSIYGAGIKILEIQEGITKTEIKVPSDYLVSDTLNIKLRFEINGKKAETEFDVPVKSR